MSVVSLLRPASVIESSDHVSVSTNTRSTLAFNEPCTSSLPPPPPHSVNYADSPSPISAPKHSTTENNNQIIVGGLYDEILSALSDETLCSVNSERDERLTNNNTKFSNLAFRDHKKDSAEIRSKIRSNLRKYKSRTMNSIYDKTTLYRNHKFEHDSRSRMSRSCNVLSDHKKDYEVKIESLSDFAKRIRRLSLENEAVDCDNQGVTDFGNQLYHQRKLAKKSRRHSTIPLKKISSPDQAREADSQSHSQHTSVPPCIYEFV